MIRVKLAEQPKYKKFQLASAAGFTVKEICPSGKCIIVGEDKYIAKNFRSFEDVLINVKDMLERKDFNSLKMKASGFMILFYIIVPLNDNGCGKSQHK